MPFFGKKHFRFEKWWLNQDSFCQVLEKAWNSPCVVSSSIDRWQFKFKLLEGWLEAGLKMM